jgi:3-dehydroquinate synthase
MPVAPPRLQGRPWDPDRLVGHMASDKKVRDGRVTFILSRGIGQAFVARDIEPGLAREAIVECLGEGVS